MRERASVLSVYGERAPRPSALLPVLSLSLSLSLSFSRRYLLSFVSLPISRLSLSILALLSLSLSSIILSVCLPSLYLSRRRYHSLFLSFSPREFISTHVCMCVCVCTYESAYVTYASSILRTVPILVSLLHRLPVFFPLRAEACVCFFNPYVSFHSFDFTRVSSLSFCCSGVRRRRFGARFRRELARTSRSGATVPDTSVFLALRPR